MSRNSRILTAQNIKKENFNHHNFSANKQYVKILTDAKWDKSLKYFLVKMEILARLWFKGLNYHKFYIFDNIKRDRYLNSFQQLLFGLLRLTKYQTSLQNFFPRETRLLNMTWSNLRFSVWRSFVAKSTNLPSCFLIKFLKQLLKSLVNFTLLK